MDLPKLGVALAIYHEGHVLMHERSWGWNVGLPRRQG